MNVVSIVITYFLWKKYRSRKKKFPPNFSHKKINYLKIYSLLMKIPLVGVYFHRIEMSIRIIELSDLYTIRKKTIRLGAGAFSISLILFGLIFYIASNIYTRVLSLLIIVIINNQIINYYLEQLEKKLLIQFQEFIQEVKHYYHSYNMIDEAIYDASNYSNTTRYEMSLHGNAFYKILTSNDVESEIEKYYDIAPNKYFKTFLALCNLVQRFGDRIVEERSVFLSNINYLREEVKYELLRKEKLDMLLKSLSFIVISPVFFVKLIEKWAVNNIRDLQVYYDGVYGFVIQLSVFFLVFIAYYIIERMKVNGRTIKIVHNSFLVSRIYKIKKVSTLMKKIIEKRYGKYLTYRKELQRSGVHTTVEMFYLQRLLLGIGSFIIAVVIIVNGIQIQKNNVLDQMTKDSVKYYVTIVQNEEISSERLQRVIKAREKIDGQILMKKTEMTMGYIEQYYRYGLEWWYICFPIAISIVFYNIPLIFLKFRRKIMSMTIEEEVVQFQTIILMLMNFERLSVEDLLLWLERFSIVFKPYIRECINDFEYGDISALKRLKYNSTSRLFRRIIDNMIIASDKISISSAFDDLLLERKYYKDKRRQDIEVIIKKKGIIGKLIAFAPIFFVLVFYLLVPFIMFSIRQLINYSEQMNNIL